MAFNFSRTLIFGTLMFCNKGKQVGVIVRYLLSIETFAALVCFREI